MLDSPRHTRLLNCSITIDRDLLTLSDRRARQMDLTRSQYFRRLARHDLGQEPPAIGLREPTPEQIPA